jgi:hypothetical protein
MARRSAFGRDRLTDKPTTAYEGSSGAALRCISGSSVAECGRLTLGPSATSARLSAVRTLQGSPSRFHAPTWTLWLLLLLLPHVGIFDEAAYVWLGSTEVLTWANIGVGLVRIVAVVLLFRPDYVRGIAWGISIAWLSTIGPGIFEIPWAIAVGLMIRSGFRGQQETMALTVPILISTIAGYTAELTTYGDHPGRAHIPLEFYSQVSQILPVLLLALVVEQRVFGSGEDERSPSSTRGSRAYVAPAR